MKPATLPHGCSATGFHTYLRDIDETPLLSAGDERALAVRIAAGDPSARDHLVRANLRLVVSIARRYLDRGLLLEDLIAEGNLGLMRAVESFDGGRGCRFATYASFWIKQSIRRAVLNQGQLLRLPAYTINLLTRWRRATAVLTERLGRAPTPGEIGVALRFSKKKVDIVIQAIRVSIMMKSTEISKVYEDEDGLDHLCDERSRHVADLVVNVDDFDRLNQALERLDERGATVVRMRFGLAPYTPMSLQEVGSQLDLSRERIRQLEKKALRRLMEFA